MKACLPGNRCCGYDSCNRAFQPINHVGDDVRRYPTQQFLLADNDTMANHPWLIEGTKGNGNNIASCNTTNLGRYWNVNYK